MPSTLFLRSFPNIAFETVPLFRFAVFLNGFVHCAVFQCELWMREGSQLLINIGRQAPECRKPQQAAELIQNLERYVEKGKPLQEQRLQKVSELAIQLYGTQQFAFLFFGGMCGALGW